MIRPNDFSPQVDQSPLQSGGGGLGPVGYPELAEETIDVTLNGRFADFKTGSYLFVALPFHDQFQHLQLPGGQIRSGHSFSKSFRYGSGDAPRTGVYRSD